MIIGLVGFMGSGKGTAGDILSEKYGFTPLSFAGGVKDVTSVMFNWPRELLEGNTDDSRLFRETPCEYWSEKMGRPFTPREALQRLGTECGRDMFNRDFWVHQLESHIISKFNEDDNIVITDVRFPNEMEWIQSKGGYVVQIDRGALPVWYSDLYDAVDDDPFRKNLMSMFGVHESEYAWVGHKVDFSLGNNGTVEDLQNNIDLILTKIGFYDTINA